MKNLITDKPSPITVALGQKAAAAGLAQAKAKGDGAQVFTLMDQNVTKGQMKNLITDKPSPITVALGQKAPANAKNIQMEKTVSTKVVKRVQTKTGVKCYNADDQTIDCELNGHNVTIGALKNIVTDKPAPITVPLSEAQRPTDKKFVQLESELGLEKKHHHKKNRKTLPDDNRNADGSIVNGGDEVKGMAGNEVVHGAASVTGNSVTFSQKKKNRITGLYSEDPLPTFSWWDGYNKEHHEENASLGQVDMRNIRNFGLQSGEDMGLDSLTLDGHKYDLKQTEAEKEELERQYEKEHNWVSQNDAGDKDPALKSLRSHIKKGVLSYSDYMSQHELKF